MKRHLFSLGAAAVMVCCGFNATALGLVQTNAGPVRLEGGVLGDIFTGYTESLLENGISLGLNALYNDSPQKFTGGLLVMVDGSTGLALDQINAEVQQTLQAVNQVQQSLNAFELSAANSFAAIEQEVDWQTYNAAVEPLNDASSQLKQLAQDYAQVTNACCSHGVLKTNLSFMDQQKITHFINDVSSADLPTMLQNLATAGNPPLGQGIYDITLAHARLNTAFGHQTYAPMYQLFNYLASLRNAACYYYKEYQGYQWCQLPEEVKQTISLQEWLDAFYIPQVSGAAAQINQEATNSLANLGRLLAGAPVTNQDAVAYLQSSISQTNIFVDDSGSTETNAVYQLVSNQDGKTYLVLQQARKLRVQFASTNFDTFNGGVVTEHHSDYTATYQTRTLDGRYVMAETMDRIAGSLFPVTSTDLLSYLRSAGGLTNLDVSTLGLLLSRRDTNTSVKWPDSGNPRYTTTEQLYLLDIQNCNLQDVTGKQYLDQGANVSTEDILNGSTYSFSGYPEPVMLTNALFLSVYYDTYWAAGVENPTHYFRPTDRSAIPSLFSLLDGDILDLSDFSGSMPYTVRICGDATIIGGGSSRELRDLTIETYGGNLTLSNLYVLNTNGPALSNAYGGLTLRATAASRLRGNCDQGVVCSSSGSNLVFTGTASLVLSNTSTGPAVQATGGLIVLNAANLTFGSQGATSLCAGQGIGIANSTVRSRVGQESNLEFNSPAVGRLEDCTLDLTYGITNQFQISNCVWAGKVRYWAQLSTCQGPEDWKSSDTGTDDRIDMKLRDTRGTSVSVSDIANTAGAELKAGGTLNLYFSSPPLQGGFGQVTFTTSGNDGWYPEQLTVNSLASFNGQSLKLYKWVDSKQSVIFYPDDLCVNMTVSSANVAQASTSAKLYSSLVHDGGQVSPEVRIDDLANQDIRYRNTTGGFSVTFGRWNQVTNIEGIMLRSDQGGLSSGWKVSTVNFSTSSNICFGADLWILNQTNNFLGWSLTNTGVFEVTVKTANANNAGTDAKIYLKLYGSAGSTDFVNIKGIPTYDAFEQGSTDTFRVGYSRGIGTLQKIELYIERDGIKPDWTCQYVEVAAVAAEGVGQKYHFDVNHTFESSTDHRIVANPQFLTQSPPLGGEPAQLVLTAAGAGSISPDWRGTSLKAVGRSYTVTAVPAAGYTFTGWSGGLASKSAALTFVMRPGLVLRANFAPSSSTYSGLFYGTNGATHENSGFISLTTTARRNYSGQVRIGGRTFSLSGQLDGEGRATNLVQRPHQSPLEVEWLVSDEDWVSGTVSNASWTATLLAARRIYDSPAPQTGRYTLAIAGTNGDITLPQGHGYGTLTISKAGLIRFAGALADGTKFSQSVPLSQQGLWPLYGGLYSGQGLLLGWLSFTNTTQLEGVLLWTRPVTPNSRYPSGFAWTTEAVGSRYEAPAKATNVLGAAASNLTLSLQGGGLEEDLANPFTLDALDRAQAPALPERLTWSCNRSTGQFHGTQIIPGTRGAISFNGVFLQDRGVGAGCFLGAEQGGAVWLEQDNH